MSTASSIRLVSWLLIRHLVLVALIVCSALAMCFCHMATGGRWLATAIAAIAVVGTGIYFGIVRSWTRWLALLCSVAVVASLAQMFWRIYR